jgi:hypothetical protein
MNEVPMDQFVAVILICLNTVPAEQCDEKSAVDVLSSVQQNELGCVTGWQEDISRSSLRKDIGVTAYVRTLCRRETIPKR